jgi:hypothetical protein
MEKELTERREPLRRQAMDSFMIIVMCDGLCMLLLSWIFDGPVAVALHYLSTAVNEDAEKWMSVDDVWLCAFVVEEATKVVIHKYIQSFCTKDDHC